MMLAALLFSTLAAASLQEPPAAAPDANASEDVLPRWSDRDRQRIARLSPLGPPPADPTNRVCDDPRAARLGQALFFDPRLSGPGTISCATCHDPNKLFQDGLPAPDTLGRGKRKTQSLLGVAHQRWFFWDGRADSLWSQALDPIENPIEMGSSRLAVAHVVHSDPLLREAYEALFGPLPQLDDLAHFPAHGRPVPDDPDHPHARAWESMSAADQSAIDRVYANTGKAIAAYERLLVPGPSDFDRFAGALASGEDGSAELGASEQRGLALFLGRANCVLCHDGPSFSDAEFHNTGAPAPGGYEDLDPGRYAGVQRLLASSFHAAGPHSDAPECPAGRRVRNLRQNSESWGEFKTPSLRNVVGRGPYMHAGQLASLEDVLRFYSTLEGASGRSHHQEQTLAPIRLTPEEVHDLRAFLGALTSAPLADELLRRPPGPLLGAPSDARGR